MPDILWQPTPEAIPKTQMMQFMHYVNNAHQQSLTDYDGLYQWSVDQPEAFWVALFDFFNIITPKKWDDILINKHQMLSAKWFVGAQLNFAENLLRYYQEEQTALIFRNERGERRTVSFPELYLQTAKFAEALKKADIQAGDRIVAVMPNMPETIIAMLAATSLGAVFSSCSPDFGAHGLIDRFGQISPNILLTVDGYTYDGKSHPILEKISDVEKQISTLKKIIVLPYLETTPDISILHAPVLYHDFINNHATHITFSALPFDHPIYILYSSGTTGVPKCIVHGAGGVLLQHMKELILHTDLKKEDSLFYFTTCGWMMWHWSVSALAAGATLLLYDGSPFYPRPDALFDIIDTEKVSVFGTGAKFISAVEKYKVSPIDLYALTQLRTILSTGSPLLPPNFDYVYHHIKKDVCLSSISGGTDIISCFALGNPILPVHKGELQCRGLGLKVEIYNDAGDSVIQEKGELVCTAPFPVMPIYFWNDPDQEKYKHAYFEKFPGVWAHGDYAEITEHNGLIIYGRSDATLNPGGIRIGTAEIYRQVEQIDAIVESIVIGQDWEGDVRVVLFVRLQNGLQLNEALKDEIKQSIKNNASPHHVPAKIIQVTDIPRTRSGKIMELTVREIVHGKEIRNKDAIANPESLAQFENLCELQF